MRMISATKGPSLRSRELRVSRSVFRSLATLATLTSTAGVTPRESIAWMARLKLSGFNMIFMRRARPGSDEPGGVDDERDPPVAHDRGPLECRDVGEFAAHRFDN